MWRFRLKIGNGKRKTCLILRLGRDKVPDNRNTVRVDQENLHPGMERSANSWIDGFAGVSERLSGLDKSVQTGSDSIGVSGVVIFACIEGFA
jgi:hypothetical protein